MKPDDAMGDGRTRVLLAVARQRRPTVRSVAKEAGRSLSGVHRHLEALRADELIWWEWSSQGTLHSLVAEVPYVR